jgi:hypothetical protein
MKTTAPITFLTAALFTALPCFADDMSSTSTQVTNDATGTSTSQTTTTKTESVPFKQEKILRTRSNEAFPGSTEVTKTYGSVPQQTTTQTETQVHY